jgi:hypothetical protein
MELTGKPNRGGIPVIENYAGPGQDRVLLRRNADSQRKIFDRLATLVVESALGKQSGKVIDLVRFGSSWLSRSLMDLITGR